MTVGEMVEQLSRDMLAVSSLDLFPGDRARIMQAVAQWHVSRANDMARTRGTEQARADADIIESVARAELHGTTIQI
jgi:hypothetical protein